MKHRIKPFRIKIENQDNFIPRWDAIRNPKGIGYTHIACIELPNGRYHCVVDARKYQSCDVDTIEQAEKWITDTYVALLDGWRNDWILSLEHGARL